MFILFPPSACHPAAALARPNGRARLGEAVSLVTLGLVCLLSFMGCGKRETPVEAGIRTRTLHVGNGVEPQGLDPQTTTGANDANVQLALFEPLVSHDPVTGLPAPGSSRSNATASSS